MKETRKTRIIQYAGRRTNTKGATLYEIVAGFEQGNDNPDLETLWYGTKNWPSHKLAIGQYYSLEFIGTRVFAQTLKLLTEFNFFPNGRPNNIEQDKELIEEWVLKDKIAASARTEKAVVNKIKKENGNGLENMTLDEISKLSYTMTDSQRSILAAKVLKWVY